MMANAFMLKDLLNSKYIDNTSDFYCRALGYQQFFQAWVWINYN